MGKTKAASTVDFCTARALRGQELCGVYEHTVCHSIYTTTSTYTCSVSGYAVQSSEASVVCRTRSEEHTCSASTHPTPVRRRRYSKRSTAQDQLSPPPPRRSYGMNLCALVVLRLRFFSMARSTVAFPPFFLSSWYFAANSIFLTSDFLK